MAPRSGNNRNRDGRQGRSSSSSYGSSSSRGRGGNGAGFAAVDTSNRITLALLLFVGIAVILVLRIAFLSLIAGPGNAAEAADSRTVSVVLEARRGTIYDRNGTVLATSVDATTVYCNPYEVTDARAESIIIAGALGGQPADYMEALTGKGSFAYLMRKADVEAAQYLKNQDLDGVYFLKDTKRVYPCGQVGGQVIGICDTDGNGVCGLELYYDDILSGTDGTSRIERGGGGYPIAGGLREVKPAVDGQDIVVSLDAAMQEYVETRLTQAVTDIEGKRGSSIVYDGSTGEILAIASTPYLNPADRSKVEEGATTLLPINMQFEPGSTFKSVTMAAILESGVLTPQSEIFCPTSLQADEYSISDAHYREEATYTLTEILARSSNVGTALAAEKLGFDNLYQSILKYGFTELTGVDFPGEAKGYCADSSKWSLARAYNISFGQGITVTPLQLARFYGAVSTGGYACRPHFLLSIPQTGETTAAEKKTIIDETKVTQELTGMLEEVVSSDDGTGYRAQIDGFAVAGKTGTAQVVGDSGTYLEDSNNISFIGFLPNTTSNIVCFVGVTEVPGDRQTTLPFKDIMSFAINRYRITAQ